MGIDQDIAELRQKLQDWASGLPELRQKLQEESALLPHDWEVQEQLKSANYYCSLMVQAICDALNHPQARNNIECLSRMDTKAECIAQTICFATFTASIKAKCAHIMIDPVVRGSWADTEILPVEDNIRERMVELIKSLGRYTSHIMQLHEPELYPWKERKTAHEIAALKETSEALEKELLALVSSKAEVTYSRYLQLETILGSYEHFEAHALDKSHVQWTRGGTLNQVSQMQ